MGPPRLVRCFSRLWAALAPASWPLPKDDQYDWTGVGLRLD